MPEDIQSVLMLPKKNKTPKEHHDLEMVPITTNTPLDLNIRNQKALEEKGIDPGTYEKYLRQKCGNSSFIIP